MGIREDMALAISKGRGLRSDYKLAQGKFIVFTDTPKIVDADKAHDKMVAQNYGDKRETNIDCLSLDTYKFGSLYIFIDYGNKVMVAFKESSKDEDEFVSKSLMYMPMEELVKLVSLPYIQKQRNYKALVMARVEGLI